jgi:hypothetical protein
VKAAPAPAPASAPAAEAITVRSHPKAAAQVRAAKGWGGLIGFGGAVLLSLRAGVPPEVALLRGLQCGVIMLLLAWGCTIAVWRHLIVAELRARRHDALAKHREALEARAAAREAADARAGR